MSTPFVGQIQLFGFGIVPSGWLTCSGQLLPIPQNQVLFTLLGTAFGGNGSSTFALPDLRGAFIVSPSANVIPFGQAGGETSHTLSTSELPSHNHQMVASSATAPATALMASGDFPAVASPGVKNYGILTDVFYGTGSDIGGGNQAHPNLQPYLALNYCIATVGIYPSRS